MYKFKISKGWNMFLFFFDNIWRIFAKKKTYDTSISYFSFFLFFLIDLWSRICFPFNVSSFYFSFYIHIFFHLAVVVIYLLPSYFFLDIYDSKYKQLVNFLSNKLHFRLNTLYVLFTYTPIYLRVHIKMT